MISQKRYPKIPCDNGYFTGVYGIGRSIAGLERQNPKSGASANSATLALLGVYPLARFSA
jgi:hypothetical protein